MNLQQIDLSMSSVMNTLIAVMNVRVYDHNVAEDYYAAMEKAEKRLSLAIAGDVKVPVNAQERTHLLALTEQLGEPELSKKERLELVGQMRWLLTLESVLE